MTTRLGLNGVLEQMVVGTICRWRMKNSIQKFGNKRGFGLTEVLVASLILGFLYLAVLQMQVGTSSATLRIRGRDVAIEVAQSVLDDLKSKGAASLNSKDSESTVIPLDTIEREVERGIGKGAIVKYAPEVTVFKTKNYESTNNSLLDTLDHVYAKHVNVKVSWKFHGAELSVNVPGVIQ